MKKFFDYSVDKFNAFSNEKKLKVLVEFIEHISSNWNNEEYRNVLISNFQHCLNLISEDFIINKQIIESISRKTGHIDSLQDFLNLTKQLWQRFPKKDFDLISSPITKTHKNNSLPVNVVLENLRSSFNVGSIIRTSECFNIAKLFFCGYTPTPANEKVKKTAMGTSEHIIWVQVDDISSLIADLRKTTTVVALETSDTALSINKTIFPKPLTIILGNEAFGISKEILDAADMIVKIPLLGSKESLNVATAYGIACYEIFRQWS